MRMKLRCNALLTVVLAAMYFLSILSVLTGDLSVFIRDNGSKIIVEGSLNDFPLFNGPYLDSMYQNFNIVHFRETQPVFDKSWIDLDHEKFINVTSSFTDEVKTFDAVLRFSYLIDIFLSRLNTSIPLFLYYSAEFGTIDQPERFTNNGSFSEFLHLIKIGYIYPITSSTWSAAALKDHDVSPFVIPYGVNTSLYKPIERRKEIRLGLKIPESAFVFLTIGKYRLYPHTYQTKLMEYFFLTYIVVYYHTSL